MVSYIQLNIYGNSTTALVLRDHCQETEQKTTCLTGQEPHVTVTTTYCITTYKFTAHLSLTTFLRQNQWLFKTHSYITYKKHFDGKSVQYVHAVKSSVLIRGVYILLVITEPSIKKHKTRWVV